jgi:hypothetical protein
MQRFVPAGAAAHLDIPDDPGALAETIDFFAS